MLGFGIETKAGKLFVTVLFFCAHTLLRHLETFHSTKVTLWGGGLHSTPRTWKECLWHVTRNMSTKFRSSDSVKSVTNNCLECLSSIPVKVWALLPVICTTSHPGSEPIANSLQPSRPTVSWQGGSGLQAKTFLMFVGCFSFCNSHFLAFARKKEDFVKQTARRRKKCICSLNQICGGRDRERQIERDRDK